MAKGFKGILKLIVNTLITIVFAVLILIIVAKVSMLVNEKQYFETFGYSFFNVATGSMEPAISQNDIIIVKKTDDYVVGDIVTFEKDGEYITHRIIDIANDIVTTKGDANNTNDVAISKEDIIGEVIHTFKSAGIWQKIFTTPQIIVAIFVTLVLFDFAFSYKGKNKEEEVRIVQVAPVVLEEEPEDNKKKKNKKKRLVTEEFSDEDTVKLYKKLERIKEEKKEASEPEEDYTIRLDLTGMQKEIDEKLKKEE